MTSAAIPEQIIGAECDTHWHDINNYYRTAVDALTSGSAMAEGPRNVLVSRNSATYKTSHLETRVSGLSCVIICRRTDRRTDGQTHDDGMYRT